MLSHHDRSELAKIERSLELTDPELAAALRDGRHHRTSRGVRTALLVLLDVLGVALLVTGLVVTDPGLTLCAILLLTASVVVHFARRSL